MQKNQLRIWPVFLNTSMMPPPRYIPLKGQDAADISAYLASYGKD